ncbi:MAG: protein kinase domain-containing protein [Pseudonocardiaceae bacterium]
MPAGTLIADRYRLLGELPAVPPRVLWQARDEWTGQLVCATQVSMAGLSEQEILLARYSLSREVRGAEGFQHRHVIPPRDAVLDADDLWVISESMPETTLAEVLVQHGMAEPEQAARWGRDIADALAAAHGAGVLHRDLHAAVVGVADDGATVVGGFAATALTSVGLGAGVPLHVAPELAQGEPASPATDVFALAAMLYTAMEGREPYPATHNRTQLLRAASIGVITAPQRAGPLSGLLVQMLDPEPSRRPSAAAVRDLLAQIACPPSGVPRRRRRVLIAVVLGVLVLLGGLIAALVTLGYVMQPDPSWGAARTSARIEFEGTWR